MLFNISLVKFTLIVTPKSLLDCVTIIGVSVKKPLNILHLNMLLLMGKVACTGLRSALVLPKNIAQMNYPPAYDCSAICMSKNIQNVNLWLQYNFRINV